MKFPIPDDALDDRLAFIGRTGSGKTFGAGACVERILAKKGRVIIPDPLGVWWGLRLQANGKKPSPYEVVVFGGKHADLPITPHAGALIGETVAGMRESAIIDFSQFDTSAQERRFMLAFLDAIYRKTAGEPVHLVFDEADQWCPERIMDKEGDATKLHSMMQTVVRRGRIKGLTSWLITQRPAVLSKSVLSQMDGLVAFQLTSPTDRKALGAWIEGQADKEQGKEILARIPEKQQGEAVVWLPARGILDDLRFPLKETYDSSRAPKRGEKLRAIALKPLDLAALHAKLATVEAEVKANDPRALRAELAAAKKKIADLERKREGAADQKSLDEAERRGFADGVKSGFRDGYDQGWVAARDRVTDDLRAFFTLHANEKPNHIPEPKNTHRPGLIRRVHVPDGKTIAAAAPVAAPAPRYNNVPSGTLSGPQQRIIDAIRWWNVLGIAEPSHPQVAFIANYSHKSGTWANYLGQLRTAGLINQRGPLALTPDGAVLAQEPSSAPTPEALREIVLAKVTGPHRRILEPLITAYPNELSHQEVADKAGYSPQSGTWANYLGQMRSLDLIAARGPLRAQDWLFPGGS